MAVSVDTIRSLTDSSLTLVVAVVCSSRYNRMPGSAAVLSCQKWRISSFTTLSEESATPAVLQKPIVIPATIRNQKKHHIQPIGTSVNLILVGQNAAV
jgi:hypothetical protein